MPIQQTLLTNPPTFEQIEVEVEGRTITHTEIEEIMGRPSWEFRDAMARLDNEARQAEIQKRPVKRTAKKARPLP